MSSRKPTSPQPNHYSYDITTPRRITRTARLGYDVNHLPAMFLPDDQRQRHPTSLVVKGYDLALEELRRLGLLGIRMRFIILVDGSRSNQRNFIDGHIAKMLQLTAGYAMMVDPLGKTPVIIYSTGVAEPFYIAPSDHDNIGDMLRPDYGSTNMPAALHTARAMASQMRGLVCIVNISDGNPRLPDRTPLSTENETLEVYLDTSGEPIIVKNLAVLPVGFFNKVDTLESRWEYRLDSNGNALRRGGKLVLVENRQAVRWVNNVRTLTFDPTNVTPAQFVRYMANRLPEQIEIMARTGILGGVPGLIREFY